MKLNVTIGMHLYDVPKKSKIKVLDEEPLTPPRSPKIVSNDILTFESLDGAYGICHNNKGKVCYLHAQTQVEIIK